ncbi:MAG: permease-like cell division protein FtsX [Actinomycetota bacterium]
MTVRDGGDRFADDIEPWETPPFAAAEPPASHVAAATSARDPYVEAGWPETTTPDPYVEAGWADNDDDQRHADEARRSDNRALLASCGAFMLVVLVGVGGMIAAGIGLANNIDEILGEDSLEPARCYNVWLDVSSTADQVDAIGQTLGGMVGADRITYMDKDAIYAEVVSHYANQPEVIELIDPDELPTSYAVTAGLDADQRQELRAIPGVVGVNEDRFSPGCT